MEQQTYKRASFADVVKYSFGGIGSNMAFYLVMSYLTFFYTDIFGIDTMVVSGLMLVSRFIDAFTDPPHGHDRRPYRQQDGALPSLDHFRRPPCWAC